jgi:hypothetical protein
MFEHGPEVGRGVPDPIVVRAIEDEDDEGDGANE